MLGLSFVAGAALLAQGVFGEGVHFLNCRSFGDASIPTRTYVSIVAYCANDADCSNISYNIPDSNACVMSSTTAYETFHQWEGSSQSCTFADTGVTFSWNIPANAQSLPNYSSVGTASNGFKTFAGFKDDNLNGANYNYHSCTRKYYYI